MRTLLHVIDTTGPGGAETVFLNLVRGFDEGGYRSVPLVAPDSWLDRTLRSDGVGTEVAQATGSFNTAYLRAIIGAVRRYKVDLVQSHLPGPNLYASLAGILTGTPVVSVVHGTVDLTHEERFRQAKTHLVNMGSRRIIAVSHHLRRELERRTALDRSKLHVIHNGVDVRAFEGVRGSSLRAEVGIPEGALLVGSVGNIRPAKGYDVLIEAAHLVESMGGGVHFVIAGQPRKGLYEDLLRLREARRVEATVHFLGFRSDAAEIFAGCDLFLLPSTSEGFSISTIEAMACGVPVVATRSGGPEEIIEDGVDGVLVPAGDPDAIAQAVLRLARDPELRRRLAARARHTVEQRFSLEAMLRGYGEVYESVLGRAGARTKEALP